MNKRVLSLVQLPPPVHGAAVMNKIVVSLFENSNSIENRTIEMKFSKSLSDLRKPSFSKFLSVFIILFKLLKQLIFNRPSLVYFTLTPTGGGFLRDCLYVLVIKMFNIRLVYHLHGKGVNNFSKKKWLFDFLYKKVFKNETVILLAKELYSDVAKYVRFENVIIVPNGLDCTSNKKAVNQSITKYCFLSNLVQGKGVIDFLEAFYELYIVSSDIEAIVIGGYRADGTQLLVESFLQNKDIEFSKRIKFLGPLYNEEKIAALCASDVFVLPTHIDTFPLVLIEAMANSLPCIAYDEGATFSMVSEGDVGYVIEKGRIDLLSKAMKKFIDDPTLVKKMSLNARKKYENEYTQEKFESRMIDAITSIINTNN